MKYSFVVPHPKELPPPIRDYEWAVDALIEALSYMNKGEPEKAHLSMDAAPWHPDRHPKLPTSPLPGNIISTRARKLI